MFEELFEERLHHVHLDFHTPEFPACAVKNLDAESLVKTLADARVNVVKVFAKDHYGNAYYNTRLGHKHRGLEEDMLGEVIKYAKEYDVKVIAYYSICCEERAAKENPDWAQRDVDGNVLGVGGFWKDVCLNSPYRYEWVYPQLREIIDNYDIDGLWLDMIYFLPKGCYCGYCRDLFKREHGRDIVDAEGETVRGFRREALRNFLKEVKQIVKASGKKLAIMGNGCGFIEQSRPEFAQNLMGRQAIDLVDCHVAEAQPAWDGYASLSGQARYLRTLDKPFEVLSVRFIAHWGEWTFKPVPQLKHEFSTILANGGVISCGDQAYPDGTLEPQAYRNIGEAFRFIEEREGFTKGAETVKHTAFLNCNNNYRSTYGATKMLIECHQQFNIVDAEALDAIDDYEVLILGSVGELSETAGQRIREFVKRGGVLVATFDSCVHLLADVLGILPRARSPYTVGYISGLFDYPVLVKGESMEVATAAAAPVAELLFPLTKVAEQRFFSHLDAPPRAESLYPSVTVNSYGKGKAIYIASPLFRAFWDTQHHPLKTVFSRISDEHVAPYMVTNAPSSVEINVMKKEESLIVNFVNFHCERPGMEGYPYIEQIPPCRDISFSIRADKPKAVVLQPSGRALQFTHKDGRVNVEIPEINIYDLLEIKY